MELKNTVATNIAQHRKAAGLTQLQLAERLNYSDKAVSKWESGASLPDIEVLGELAAIFGIKVEALLNDGGVTQAKHEKISRESVSTHSRAHVIITLLSVMLVWLCATCAFVFVNLDFFRERTWLAFVWAVPVSLIVTLVFNSIWGRRRMNYLIISALMWTLLAAIYLTLLEHNYWLLFIIGIPGQTIICLWSGLGKSP